MWRGFVNESGKEIILSNRIKIVSGQNQDE
jgi:hypothetical protein